MSGLTLPKRPTHRNFYFIVPHPAESRVLMLNEGEEWSLPHYVSQERFYENVSAVLDKVREFWGLEATILRCVYFVYVEGEVENRLEAVFGLENHNQAWHPPGGGAWVEAATLSDLSMAVEAHREVILTWLTERETGIVPPERSPWAREGWLAGAQGWIVSELSRLGITVTGPIEQLKTWGISCLLTVPTTQGTFYFKAVPPIFAQEPMIARALSELFPANVPAPVAVRLEPEQSWMLLRDIGGKELRESATPEQWAEAIALLYKMQAACASDVSSLLELGCADRRLECLAQDIDSLLDDPLAVSELKGEEVDKLKAFAPRLKEMCAALSAYCVPQTLIHGDFHGGNIFVREGEYVVFDWTDAAVSHPFFDLPTLMQFDIPEGQREPLPQTYIRLWSQFEPEERLQEAYRLSQPLALMHHAVSYRNIVAMLEPSSRWEMFGGATHWLRSLVGWIDQYESKAEAAELAAD